MIILEPVIDERAIVTYISQTFTGWHDGVARRHYAAEWLASTGPLSRDEERSARLLKEALQANDGCRMLYRVLNGETMPFAIRSAFDVLEDRSRKIMDSCKPQLIEWQRFLWDPPSVLEAMFGYLDDFFGFNDSRRVRVYLFPSVKGGVGGNGSMYVEDGATTLECGGLSRERQESVISTLVHEIAHSVYQRIFLEPILVNKLENRRSLILAYDDTPIGRSYVNLPSMVGEMLVHSLTPHGVLRELCGLDVSVDHYWKRITDAAGIKRQDESSEGDIYDFWVMAAAAEMVSHTRQCINDGRRFDAEWVERALDVVGSMVGSWSSNSIGKSPSV